jgi:hypothetical protein
LHAAGGDVAHVAVLLHFAEHARNVAAVLLTERKARDVFRRLYKAAMYVLSIATGPCVALSIKQGVD